MLHLLQAAECHNPRPLSPLRTIRTSVLYIRPHSLADKTPVFGTGLAGSNPAGGTITLSTEPRDSSALVSRLHIEELIQWDYQGVEKRLRSIPNNEEINGAALQCPSQTIKRRNLHVSFPANNTRQSIQPETGSLQQLRVAVITSALLQVLQLLSIQYSFHDYHPPSSDSLSLFVGIVYPSNSRLTIPIYGDTMSLYR